MIFALWLIRAIAGQIVGIVVYRSASDEVIAEWTQVATGLVALAKAFLLALVVVPLLFVAVHLHRRLSESPSRHLGALAPARVAQGPQPATPTGGLQPMLAGPETPVLPFGAEVTGGDALAPIPELRPPAA